MRGNNKENFLKNGSDQITYRLIQKKIYANLYKIKQGLGKKKNWVIWPLGAYYKPLF